MFPVTTRKNWQSVGDREGLARFTEMDRVFDRFFGTDGGLLSQVSSRAPLSIWEDADRLHVEADLPGVNESDLEVTVHKGVLTIRGQRKAVEGRSYVYNGRGAGPFHWNVKLPETVAGDPITATLAGGVLHVELTKTVDSKPKKISVQVP